jgi:hypothetical protein
VIDMVREVSPPLLLLLLSPEEEQAATAATSAGASSEQASLPNLTLREAAGRAPVAGEAPLLWSIVSSFAHTFLENSIMSKE